VFVIAACVAAAIQYAIYRNSFITREEFTSLEYDGEIAIEVNGNKPDFEREEIQDAKEAAEKGGMEDYSRLDSLGRCGAATAVVTADTMPDGNAERTTLGTVTPSGWQKIDFWCRCHLIGYQLTGQQDNERNLITGTYRLNTSGMLPYENQIAEYMNEEAGRSVLMKVDPVFDGRNLVASGVNMEAVSLGDNGRSISFNVYIFNYQPGYIIDYSDGTVEDDPDHQTLISLADKTAEYTGLPVQADDAAVVGSTGDVRYIYYTDDSARTKTTAADGAETDGGAPSEPGTYYVRAVVAGDNWYPTAASEPAKLEIRAN